MKYDISYEAGLTDKNIKPFNKVIYVEV